MNGAAREEQMSPTKQVQAGLERARAAIDRVLALVGSFEPEQARVALEQARAATDQVAEQLLRALKSAQPKYSEQPEFQECLRALASTGVELERFGAGVLARPEAQKFAFTSRWNFLASLLLDSHQAEDIINHLQEVYERDVKRYDEKRARLLYRKNVLVSLWPVAKWVCHRTVVAGVLKHYFPAIESITRLFRF